MLFVMPMIATAAGHKVWNEHHCHSYCHPTLVPNR